MLSLEAALADSYEHVFEWDAARLESIPMNLLKLERKRKGKTK